MRRCSCGIDTGGRGHSTGFQTASRPDQFRPYSSRTLTVAVCAVLYCLSTTYLTASPTNQQDAALLSKIPWAHLLVDEAHRLKNCESALYQVCACVC